MTRLLCVERVSVIVIISIGALVLIPKHSETWSCFIVTLSS